MTGQRAVILPYHDAELTGFLQWVYTHSEFKKWFAGHFHDDRELLTFANGAASLITTRRGALKVMPEKEEILELMGR